MKQHLPKSLKQRIALIMFVALVLITMVMGLWFEVVSPRQRWISSAIRSGESIDITLASEVSVSRSCIAFSLHNSTDENISYGPYWELAQWRLGRWRPVPYVRGVYRLIPQVGILFFPNEIRHYHIEWNWLFGELLNGRYMFMREYSGEYVLFEFTISTDTPMVLP